jgi:hypothetical protein
MVLFKYHGCPASSEVRKCDDKRIIRISKELNPFLWPLSMNLILLLEKAGTQITAGEKRVRSRAIMLN